jgi:hypothetical protein
MRKIRARVDPIVSMGALGQNGSHAHPRRVYLDNELFSDVRCNKDRSGCKTLLEEISTTIIRPVRRKGVGSGPTEDRAQIMIFLRPSCQITRFLL